MHNTFCQACMGAQTILSSIYGLVCLFSKPTRHHIFLHTGKKIWKRNLGTKQILMHINW